VLSDMYATQIRNFQQADFGGKGVPSVRNNANSKATPRHKPQPDLEIGGLTRPQSCVERALVGWDLRRGQGKGLPLVVQKHLVLQDAGPWLERLVCFAVAEETAFQNVTATVGVHGACRLAYQQTHQG